MRTKIINLGLSAKQTGKCLFSIIGIFLMGFFIVAVFSCESEWALRQSERGIIYAYGESCSETPLKIREQVWDRPLTLDYKTITKTLGVECYILPSEIQPGIKQVFGVYDADFELIILFKATDGVFLHEIAHVYTKRLYGDLGHGIKFCRILDQLYREYVPEETR